MYQFILTILLSTYLSSASYAGDTIYYNLEDFKPGETITLHFPEEIRLGGRIEVLPDSSIAIHEPRIEANESWKISEDSMNLQNEPKYRTARWFCENLGLKFKNQFSHNWSGKIYSNVFKVMREETSFERHFGPTVETIYCGKEDASVKVNINEKLLSKLKSLFAESPL